MDSQVAVVAAPRGLRPQTFLDDVHVSRESHFLYHPFLATPIWSIATRLTYFGKCVVHGALVLVKRGVKQLQKGPDLIYFSYALFFEKPLL